MPGKPYQSKLIPHTQEIAELRRTIPPTPYLRIVQILKERHGLDVTSHSVWSFVKTRSKGRKVYAMQPDIGTVQPLMPDGFEPQSKPKPLPAPPARPARPANSISEKYQRDIRKPRAQKPLFSEDNIIR